MEKATLAEPVIVGLPEEKLLADRLTYALDFAKRTIEHLIIEGHCAPEEAPWYVRSEKIIAETAFLLVFAKAGLAYKQVKQAITELVRVLEPLARSEAMLLNICLKPALALDYAQAHICLNYLGYPEKTFDEALSDALKSNAAGGIERTPYRMLEQEWLRSIWNTHRREEHLKFWIPLSCLNHPVDMFSESSDGVYALTHAIMYASFGRQKIQGVDANKLLQMAEALLIRYMDEQDYDVAGELLMAWPLLGKPMSHAASFALHCLLKIESRVGFLPAPGLDRSMIEGKEQHERRTYIYSINYHTVLVMGLLCSSVLEHTKTSMTLVNKTDYSKELQNELAKELYNGKEVHWIEYYAELNSKRKQALIPWVYQALLARNVKERKYGQVKKLLELITTSNLENLVINKQAKELLQRLGSHATTKS